MRLFLCGITQNEEKNIEELTSVWEHFDGLIFADGGSTDNTLDILNSRKKEGKIVHRNWTNDFDFQNNEILRQGGMKNGDWFLLRDSQERINQDFAPRFQYVISEMIKNNCYSGYWHGKGFLFEYNDMMFFQGNPHWGIQNSRPGHLELTTFLNESDETKRVTYNIRGGVRSDADWIKHHMKYYFIYGRSNHLLLGRESNIPSFQHHEQMRRAFRAKVIEFSKGEISLDKLDEFLNSLHFTRDENMVNILKMEPILKRYYDLVILKKPVEQVVLETPEFFLK